MITIKDIALKAGVSKSTVSRVLTRKGYVNEETKRRILKVMEENNYLPSVSARTLTQKTSNTIGVIVPEISNFFFTEAFRGITGIANEKKLTIIYCNTENDPELEEKALQDLEAHRVKGIIMTPNNDVSNKNLARRLENIMKRLNTPVVYLDREPLSGTYDAVLYDNYGSAYCAAGELIKSGNRTVGIITGDMKLKIARDRYDGYKKALEDYGVPFLDKYVYEGDFGSEKAYRRCMEMFASGDYPDGIVTCNNLMTLGLLHAASDSGFVLGRDISMIGIDHIQILDDIDYNYSCVTRDIEGMGRLAMSLLLDRIENPQMEEQHIVVPYICRFKGAERKQPG